MINLSLPGFGPELAPIIVATEGAGALAGAGGALVPAAALGGSAAGLAGLGQAASGLTIGQTAGLSLLGQGITGLAGAVMQGSKKMPGAAPMPEMTSPPTMPLPDDRAAEMARRKRIAEIQNRSGRQSTFLSDEGRGDRLGGG